MPLARLPEVFLAAACLAALLCAPPLLADDESRVDFAQDIRPLLSDRCFACHGPDEEHREADLRVDSLESLFEDRGDYQVVKPGDPEQSELIRRVFSTEDWEVMPPPEMGKPLSDAEKERLRRWVADGAVWEQHWAYQSPQPVPVPELPAGTLDDELEASSPIDAYIADRLYAAGGRFAPPADRITLARRLAFDLTGLPPAPGDLESFLSDESDEALPHYVDRLLARPAYGERMAVWWLDLVRFADTVGYHGDQDHNIALYRDYVIDAFNDNKSFADFTLEQLAGDLLPEPTEEQLIATGYNRLLQTSHEGGVQPKEYLAIYAADRVRNVSAVWMGATVGCAQCHDHKFDPYTAHDFYSLAAFFADVDEEDHFRVGSNALPTRRPPEKEFLDRRARMRLAGARQRRENAQRMLAAATNPTRREELERELAYLQQQIEEIQAEKRTTMITRAVEPRVVRYLPRGNWLDDSGPIMSPAIPDFLGALEVEGRATRLDLARWLVDERHGAGLLTSRVLANRLWMLMLGEGLSRSVEDFGGQGEPPSHPELLDRLALDLVASGWDIKAMLRRIALSRTYQQSSLETDWHRQHDPLNRLLGRQNRFRIPAEMVRDTALACGDLLVREVGGESVKPYQPEGYYRHLNFPTREYSSSSDQGQWRRGVYVHWQRQFLHPMLRAFDAPTREECTARRPQSNTPLAALVWLNDPSLIEAARGLAQAILQEYGADRQVALRELFRRATSRLPDEQEEDMLTELLVAAEQHYADQPSKAVQLLEVGLAPVDQSLDADRLAAWTTLARGVLNLNETYTRN